MIRIRRNLFLNMRVLISQCTQSLQMVHLFASPATKWQRERSYWRILVRRCSRTRLLSPCSSTVCRPKALLPLIVPPTLPGTLFSRARSTLSLQRVAAGLTSQGAPKADRCPSLPPHRPSLGLCSQFPLCPFHFSSSFPPHLLCFFGSLRPVSPGTAPCRLAITATVHRPTPPSTQGLSLSPLSPPPLPPSARLV